MDGLTGLVAVIMIFGMPTAVLAMYTFYRVRKLRTEERMAAITRGVTWSRTFPKPPARVAPEFCWSPARSATCLLSL